LIIVFLCVVATGLQRSYFKLGTSRN